MADDFLRVGDCSRELPVRLAATRQRRRRVDGRGEERVGKLDPVAGCDADEAGLLSRGERGSPDEA
jgi:hypothetical protein